MENYEVIKTVMNANFRDIHVPEIVDLIAEYSRKMTFQEELNAGLEELGFKTDIYTHDFYVKAGRKIQNNWWARRFREKIDEIFLRITKNQDAGYIKEFMESFYLQTSDLNIRIMNAELDNIRIEIEQCSETQKEMERDLKEIQNDHNIIEKKYGRLLKVAQK